MPRILLIGKIGQVGWELRRTLAPLGQLVVVDFPEIDLTAPDSIRHWVRETRPDVVLNAAAYTAVDKAESEPDKAMRINGDAPAILAEETAKLGGLLVHYSTDYVFDGTKTAPYLETDTPNPLGVYGRSKLAGDSAIQAAGVRHLIFRLCWVYGARGQNFLLTMKRLAREREKLRVVRDQVGSPTWSRMIAEATALALKQVLSSSDPTAFTGLYHLAASGITSWHGFAQAIIDRIPPDAKKCSAVEAITTADYPTPARRPAYSALSCLKLERVFGLSSRRGKTASANSWKIDMKGIILAGGAGSRLFPLTLVASKQLQPVYDKPMVYYPLTTLIDGGIREFCLISTPQDLPRFRQLLGDGSPWGLAIEYREQPKPEGIAQAFLIAESFVGRDAVTLILGDNVFYGGDSFYRAFSEFKSGATIFGYHVNDPERYGVVEFDSNGRAISIQEKPRDPRSNYAVPGLYIYDNSILEITRNLKPSARGELEITDVNVEYLRRNCLHVHKLSRGFAWLDAGTSSSLHEASAYVQTIEKRAGVKIGCPEEAALRRGFLSLDRLESLTSRIPKCEYRDYLLEVLAEARRSNTGG